MKNIRKQLKNLALGLLVVGTAAFGVHTVQAAQIPYVPGQPLQTSHTPIFNPFTNIPAGVGDESDFVKLRKSNGDPTVPAATNNFVDPVNANCAVGEKFDIRTYIHNGADADYNQNGNGSAVAHNVSVAMQAPLGQTGKKFTFSSTVSASNAASVTDTGTLNCGNEVQLKLVPQTVKVYAQHLGWNNAPDSAVDGNLRVGSRVVGSGDQWGCWEDRIVVVYVVEVVAKPQVPVAVCNAITVEKIGERKYRYGIRYTANNGATLNTVTFNFGDGNSKEVTAPFTTDHEYAEAGEYDVTTKLVFTVNGQEKVVENVKECAATIKTSVEPCPTNPSLPKNSPDCAPCPIPGKEGLPKNSPECVNIPTTIPQTGIGGIITGLLGSSAAGYSAYAYLESRRGLKKLLKK
jgi:hypothetical protein